MDIVPKIKLTHLKASFKTLALKHKFFLILFLFCIVTTILPHETYAIVSPIRGYEANFVFDRGNTDYLSFLKQKSQELTKDHEQQLARQATLKKARLILNVQTYLRRQGSPLADYASVLVSQHNWKQIVALANAESSMCEDYPINKANCWGVGGRNLWDMGNNLGEGVTAMNQFLNKYPLRSRIKYAQMSFEKMNGLYKQPAAQHWLYNAQSIYDDLAAIEKNI